MKIALKECYLAGVNLDFKPGIANSSINISVQFDSSVKQDGSKAKAVLRAILSADNKYFLLDVKYFGFFYIDTEEQIDKETLSSECASLLFPYIHEFVADITRKMPLQQPVMLDFSLGNAEIYKDQQETLANEAQEEAS